MPKGTRVYRCVKKLTRKKFTYPAAIAICQKSTKQSYKTGKPLYVVIFDQKTPRSRLRKMA
jgi:hypothetical protein